MTGPRAPPPLRRPVIHWKFARLWGLSKPANASFKGGRVEVCVWGRAKRQQGISCPNPGVVTRASAVFILSPPACLLLCSQEVFLCTEGVRKLSSISCAGHLESPGFLIYKIEHMGASFLSLFVLMQQNTSDGVIYRDWGLISHSSWSQEVIAQMKL